MRATSWLAISFGYTLALVVGVRLSMEGLLLVAAILLTALLLCPIVALRWVIAYMADAPEVWVERPPTRGIGTAPSILRALPGSRRMRARRGGWPHLEGILREQARRRYVQIRRQNGRHFVDG
ncbi:MAG: hypothetical protein H0T73_10225 [Ardenticatenales bacterium]|nr:hypothetical protein [Ardenticatenales bacterium]